MEIREMFTYDGIKCFAIDKESVIICGWTETINEDLVIPEEIVGYNVIGIQSNAFEYCNIIKSVKIPNSIESIEDRTFFGCMNLTSICIPDSVISIGEKAFSRCFSLSKLSLSDSVSSIGERAFEFCIELTDVTIPKEIRNIGAYAFADCRNLKSVKFSGSVIKIDSKAFCGCFSLKKIELSGTIVSKDAFWNCDALSTIVVPKDNNTFFYKEDVLFQKFDNWIQKDNWLMYYSRKKMNEEYDVPEGTTRIWEKAFGRNKILKKLLIPDSVKKIDDGVFYGCSGLTNIIVSPDNRRYGTISRVLFDKKYKELILFPRLMNLKQYKVPKGITSIGAYAFAECRYLKRVEIPYSVRAIHDGAFYNCHKLEEVTISYSVMLIGRRAFGNCSSLTHLRIPDSVGLIDPDAFDGCEYLTLIVERNSEAEKYARLHRISYMYPDSSDWLNE